MQKLPSFATLPSTPLEQAESVDMLQAIEHGYAVRMVESPFEPYGVDTPGTWRWSRRKWRPMNYSLVTETF